MSLIRSSALGRASRVTTMLITAMVIGALTLALPAEAKSKAKKKKLSKTEKYEIQWMQKMIKHQARGILMAQAADPLTSRTEMKAFNQEFLAQEQQEMDMLKGWLTTWYGVSYVPKPPSPVVDDDDDDDEYDEDFDLALIDRLIGYLNHERAQCKQAKRKAKHQELKDYATQVILLNRTETDILKDWQRAWDPPEDDDEEEDD